MIDGNGIKEIGKKRYRRLVKLEYGTIALASLHTDRTRYYILNKSDVIRSMKKDDTEGRERVRKNALLIHKIKRWQKTEANHAIHEYFGRAIRHHTRIMKLTNTSNKTRKHAMHCLGRLQKEYDSTDILQCRKFNTQTEVFL